MQFEELWKLEKSSISALLRNRIQKISSHLDRQALQKDKQLIFAIMFTIGQEKKLPWVCDNEEVLQSCIGLLSCFSFGIQEPQTAIEAETKPVEHISYVLEGSFQKIEKQGSKSKILKKTFFSTQVLKKKHNFPIFSSREHIKVTSRLNYVRISLQSLFYFQRDLKEKYNLAILRILSKALGISFDSLQRAGVHNKLKFSQMRKGTQMSGQEMPALMMTSFGQILCRSSREVFLLVQNSFVDFFGRDHQFRMLIKKNSIFLSLSRQNFIDFLKQNPVEGKNYFKHLMSIRTDRSQFYQSINKVNKLDPAKQLLYQFQSISYKKKEKNRFSKYHRHKQYVFGDQDSDFVELTVYNIMIDSKEKVFQMKKEKQKSTQYQDSLKLLEDSQLFRSSKKQKKTKKNLLKSHQSGRKLESSICFKSSPRTRDSFMKVDPKAEDLFEGIVQNNSGISLKENKKMKKIHERRSAKAQNTYTSRSNLGLSPHKRRIHRNLSDYGGLMERKNSERQLFVLTRNKQGRVIRKKCNALVV